MTLILAWADRDAVAAAVPRFLERVALEDLLERAPLGRVGVEQPRLGGEAAQLLGVAAGSERRRRLGQRLPRGDLLDNLEEGRDAGVGGGGHTTVRRRGIPPNGAAEWSEGEEKEEKEEKEKEKERRRTTWEMVEKRAQKGLRSARR